MNSDVEKKDSQVENPYFINGFLGICDHVYSNDCLLSMVPSVLCNFLWSNGDKIYCPRNAS